MFSLQVLGRRRPARTGADCRAHPRPGCGRRSRGRVGGDPACAPATRTPSARSRASRDAAHLDGVLAQLDTWLPTVRRMRPAQPWAMSCVLNRITASTWTVERLRRTVRRLVSEGIVEAKLLDRAPRQPGDDRLIRLVAGIAAAAPDRTLQQIAAQLEAMHERTPRGGTRWHPSSVEHLAHSSRTARVGRHPASGAGPKGLAITKEAPAFRGRSNTKSC